MSVYSTIGPLVNMFFYNFGYIVLLIWFEGRILILNVPVSGYCLSFTSNNFPEFQISIGVYSYAGSNAC